ncbi:hypothetical protein AB205_0115340 [Aquarana catesbeiana]|uniref:Uncharacterized protein n=1 Tax=Aquarana catesbeiana TaxID=8400 RepID=A0A2G9RGU6_AQUCT|nr:hypothetical protein AB205_0115340 [Aquarana catesbeiana]
MDSTCLSSNSLKCLRSKMGSFGGVLCYLFISWPPKLIGSEEVKSPFYALRKPEGEILKAVIGFRVLYMAMLPKSLNHEVSPYSEEAAECILGCNSTHNHVMCEQYII